MENGLYVCCGFVSIHDGHIDIHKYHKVCGTTCVIVIKSLSYEFYCGLSTEGHINLEMKFGELLLQCQDIKLVVIHH